MVPQRRSTHLQEAESIAVATAVASAAVAAPSIASAVTAATVSTATISAAVTTAVATAAVSTATVTTSFTASVAAADAVPGELDADVHAAWMDVHARVRRVRSFGDIDGWLYGERDVARGV